MAGSAEPAKELDPVDGRRREPEQPFVRSVTARYTVRHIVAQPFVQIGWSRTSSARLPRMGDRKRLVALRSIVEL